MNVALSLLNPPGYYPAANGEGVLRVASNTVRGSDQDYGELRYVTKNQDNRRWALSQLTLAVMDALLYGDGFLTDTGLHVPRHLVQTRKGPPHR